MAEDAKTFLGNTGIPAKIRDQVVTAEARIRDHVRRTPVESANRLSASNDTRVLLKLENYQVTGSFKFRGAMNKLLSLTTEERERGVVAASSGNHGAALACGAERLRMKATLFVPVGASPAKVSAIRARGGEVHHQGGDSVETEAFARAHASERGKTYISPYNDMDVVAGQGTVGLELSQQVEPVDAVFVSLGGGGLLSGIAGYLKVAQPRTRIIACSPENSPVMHESVRAGKIVEMESKPTLSDGTAGGVEAGAITFEFCRSLIDESILVTEAEIAAAVRKIVTEHHMLIEGAAGVAVAGYLKSRSRFEKHNVVIVLCGANIDGETLRRVL